MNRKQGNNKYNSIHKVVNNVKEHTFNQVFDNYTIPQYSVYFPTVASSELSSDLEDKLLQAILDRNQQLTYKNKHSFTLQEILRIFDILIVNPTILSLCEVEEVRLVNCSHSHNNIADIVAILRDPSKESIQALMLFIQSMLIETTRNVIVLNSDVAIFQLTQKGFDVKLGSENISILIATPPNNVHKIFDSNFRYQVSRNLASIRRSGYIEKNSNSTVRILNQVLLDIASRYEDFALMTPWVINMISIFSVNVTVDRKPLLLIKAFLRVFQLLSSGIFLPNSASIVDPCENGKNRIHTYLTEDNQEKLCAISQFLLLKLLTGKYQEVLAIEEKKQQQHPLNDSDVIEIREEPEVILIN